MPRSARLKRVTADGALVPFVQAKGMRCSAGRTRPSELIVRERLRFNIYVIWI